MSAGRVSPARVGVYAGVLAYGVAVWVAVIAGVLAIVGAL